MAYEWELDEWRASGRAERGRGTATAACYGGHRMRPDGNGGGTCTLCGETVSADEL